MKRMIMAVAVLGLIGCAPFTELVQDRNFPEITNDDYSTVYMFRENRFIGSAIGFPVSINGDYLFRIGNGDCVSFKIPTGQNEIDFVPPQKRVRFMAEKGKTYYIYTKSDAGPDGPPLRQMTEKEWNEKKQSCNWVELR